MCEGILLQNGVSRTGVDKAPWAAPRHCRGTRSAHKTLLEVRKGKRHQGKPSRSLRSTLCWKFDPPVEEADSCTSDGNEDRAYDVGSQSRGERDDDEADDVADEGYNVDVRSPEYVGELAKDCRE